MDQLPEHQHGLQLGALVVGIVAVAVFADERRAHQAHLVIPHQCLFGDAVYGRKLPDGEQCLLTLHKNPPLTVLLQDGLRYR